MTTYSLRKAAADKTRTDVVVVGVCKTKKGLEAAPGGEDVASAYGRKFAPLLSTIGFHGKPGEVVKIPTGGMIKSPLLMLVGLGERDKLTTEGVRRAAGVAARSMSNAATVAVALPAVDVDHVRAVADGFLLGSYSFTEFKTSADPDRAGEVVILTDLARDKQATAVLEEAQVVAAATTMSHVTGGGLAANLERVMPEELTATIDRATWTPQPVFDLVRRVGSVSQPDLERTLNCGVGMVALTAPEDADQAVNLLAGHGVDAWVCGEVGLVADAVEPTAGGSVRMVGQHPGW